LAAGFVPVPAAPGAKDSVALARAEVTRGEYAQFANATHRAASACSEQRSAGQTATGKSWTDPGFDQGSEQPVVCVSWNDANAYAQWLSAKNGQRYRLAGTSDWRAMKAGGSAAGDAHVGGSFSEWLQNCSFLCMRHLVAGRAWREHGTDTPAGLATDRGFDDVGFRVVRVQDAQR
jgi:formylglycine-generating enzyme required for sulfatase activity